MKAVILAAGVGRRLGTAGGGAPKCLLRFGGKSLLQRHLENLRRLGVRRVVVVTGYRQDAVAAALRDLAPAMPVVALFNPDYRQGSLLSLHRARDHLQDGADVLLMDADVLYEPRLLARLLDTKKANCFLLDRDFEPGDEPVKLCVAGGALVEFSKKIAQNQHYDYQGESVGFFRFDAAVAARLAVRAAAYIAAGQRQAPYEEAIRDLLLETPEAFGFEDVTGCAWIEIDFPADVARAQALVGGIDA